MVTKELDLRVEVITPPGGAVAVLNRMDAVSRNNIGRQTLRFVQRVMLDPKLRAMVRKLAAQIKEEDDGSREGTDPGAGDPAGKQGILAQ